MMNANGADNKTNGEPKDGDTVDAPLYGSSLSLDTVLSLLSHRRRRDLVHYLIRTPGKTGSVDDCAEYLSKREEERTGKRPRTDEVRVTLHHVHIPKLSSADICEYDPRTEEIRYRPVGRLESWLDRIRAHEPDS